jgi:hypothetical protein
MIQWAWGCQVIRALSIYSVAEHLSDGPLSAHEIAEREFLDPEATFRMLRAAASIGFTEYDSDEQVVSAGELLEVLRRRSPISLKYYAESTLGPAFWLPAMRLPEAVKTGDHQTIEAYGLAAFDYLTAHPEYARTFSSSMTELSGPVIHEAVSVMNTGSAPHVIDVGGADGAFVIEMAARNPQITGEVVDLAHVIVGVADEANKRGVADRVRGVSGDFFGDLPAGDVYLLKFIMHDWDDESCIRILRNIRQAMNPGARVFIVEMVMDDDSLDPGATLMDMAMLTGFTGQERSLAQYEGLLRAADLRSITVTPIRQPYEVIEAGPIAG